VSCSFVEVINHLPFAPYLLVSEYEEISTPLFGVRDYIQPGKRYGLSMLQLKTDARNEMTERWEVGRSWTRGRWKEKVAKFREKKW
jgi:hypothetical protein